MGVSITIKNVTKKYMETEVIRDLSLEVSPGEFFTLLGPSGCGKTTLLRMIAGFASIEGGTIAFDGKTINEIPAHKRNIGMVFQNYAVFPHLTARQNVEYGLKLRKLPKQDIKDKVDDILEMVQATEFQHRLPENFSGGQQQRVALARAIVIHPGVLLMDEPLSNLDAKLRLEMRSAIREIHDKVGITTVYVTHDQEEALAISDRIAVMDAGVIRQIGTPEDIYTRPSDLFAANFIGHSNCLAGRIVPENGGYFLFICAGYTVFMDNIKDGLGECSVIAGIRPEEFVQCTSGGIEFKVKSRTFLGKYIVYDLLLPQQNSITIQWSQDVGTKTETYQVGELIMLKPNKDRINLFTADGACNITGEV